MVARKRRRPNAKRPPRIGRTLQSGPKLRPCPAGSGDSALGGKRRLLIWVERLERRRPRERNQRFTEAASANDQKYRANDDLTISLKFARALVPLPVRTVKLTCISFPRSAYPYSGQAARTPSPSAQRKRPRVTRDQSGRSIWLISQPSTPKGRRLSIFTLKPEVRVAPPGMFAAGLFRGPEPGRRPPNPRGERGRSRVPEEISGAKSVPFPLIADTDGWVAAAFGVPMTDGRAKRQSFIIKDGKVVWNSLQTKTAEHAQEVKARSVPSNKASQAHRAAKSSVRRHFRDWMTIPARIFAS